MLCLGEKKAKFTLQFFHRCSSSYLPQPCLPTLADFLSWLIKEQAVMY